MAKSRLEIVTLNRNQTCTKCVLDTTVPDITFDNKGVCQYCKIYDEMALSYPLDNTTEQNLHRLIKHIKAKGKNKKYDCIIGVSGGTDSSYTLYLTKKFGLRPLAVHLDNGWNSKIAVKNIKSLCDQLKVDLQTYVIDWEEFKSLQRSFLKASVPDAEIPTDVAIHATLIRYASIEGIKYVLNGHSFRTEYIMPLTWTYMEGKYIKSVNKSFENYPLRTFPNFTIRDVLFYNIVKGIKVIPFLNFFNYNKEEAKSLLLENFGWQYSGGHHHESIYTKFFQSYLLPQKFNIDKRKVELSAMLLSGHISRAEALEELKTPYEFEQQVVDYAINKLELSIEEFQEILKLQVKSFKDFNTYYPIILRFKGLIKFATSINLLPKLLYYKFIGV